ncbi:MAG: hypothetical protein IJS32_01815, partial [Kiritimatiellae bacterium]|nr:hypothetical protein [Kiritimatiellia bacterium]
MFGKIGPLLPNIGKSIGRVRETFCQCLAKSHEICQTLAKRKKRAAFAARPVKSREKVVTSDGDFREVAEVAGAGGPGRVAPLFHVRFRLAVPPPRAA